MITETGQFSSIEAAGSHRLAYGGALSPIGAAMLLRIHVVDDQGQAHEARVSFESIGQGVVWLAELPDGACRLPLSGTAQDEASVPAAVQEAVLRWGAGPRPGLCP